MFFFRILQLFCFFAQVGGESSRYVEIRPELSFGESAVRVFLGSFQLFCRAVRELTTGFGQMYSFAIPCAGDRNQLDEIVFTRMFTAVLIVCFA